MKEAIEVLLMAEILHQLRLVVYPIIYSVLYIPGGAGAGSARMPAIFLKYFPSHQCKKNATSCLVWPYLYILNCSPYTCLTGKEESNPPTADTSYIVKLHMLVQRRRAPATPLALCSFPATAVVPPHLVLRWQSPTRYAPLRIPWNAWNPKTC